MKPLASVALVFVVLAVLVLALAVPGPSVPAPTSTWEPNTGGPGPSPFANDPVTLNTVAYAERVVNSTVYVPDASVLGAGYRIVGVDNRQVPRNETTSTGIAWRDWDLEFEISNRSFINGTTLYGVFYATAITFNEASTPAGSTSYAAAIDFMAPPVTCHASLSNGSSTCTTDSATGPHKLVQVGGTYLVVDPTVPNGYFQVAGTETAVQIYAGGLSYQQMMSLAETGHPMIQQEQADLGIVTYGLGIRNLLGV